MSADDTPAPGASDDPGRRDGRPLPPRRPAPPQGSRVPRRLPPAPPAGPWPPQRRRPFPPASPPYAGRPERSAWRTLGLIVVGVLAVCGLMSIAITVLFVISLNQWASNK